MTEQGGPQARRAVPEATVARLPVYLRALHELAESGRTTVSSDALAERSGVGPAKLRKDLSHLGTYGTRGVGYDVAYLRYQISRQIGLTQDWSVVIVGMGNLGQALAGYGGFTSRGFAVVGLLDIDQQRVGETYGGVRVRHVDE
ncbi:MAG TPA: redox-sensing transcriptional repressor Rex, partial [Actinomycetales bacterium]